MLSSLILSLALASPLLSNAHAAEWPALETVPLQRSPEGRGDAVVIVAIEDYLKVDDIAGARANAEAWLRWFLQARGVPPSRVFKAYDGDATDLQIRELATRAAGAVQPGGTLWFVFIGHGAPSKDVQDGLLVGADADRSAQGIYQRSVSHTELLRLLEAGPQAQTVALFDACFSGQSASGQALVTGLQPLLPSALAESVRSPNTRVLTAAGSREFAGPLPGASRPAFSYLALGGLMGWADVDGVGNGDGSVSASELREYVAGALNLTVSGRTQTPELLGTDAPLARALERKAPDLMAIARTPAPPAASASAPPPAPGGARGTSFGAPTLDVSAQLKEQNCADEARTKLSAQRDQELSKESARVLAEGRAAWKALAEQGEACTKLSDKAARQPCLAAIDAWTANAKGASVELAAASGSVPTACGPRNAVDAARRGSVDFKAELAAAGELRKRVEVGVPEETTTGLVPSPVGASLKRSVRDQADALWAERGDRDNLIAALAIYQDMHERNPTDRHAMERLVRGWYFLGDGHETDQQAKVAAWTKAIEYGKLCLALNVDVTAASVMAAETAERASLAFDIADVPCVYWTSSALGKWAKAGGLATTLKYGATVKAWMKRVGELAPNYHFSGPDRYWATVYAESPSFAGQDLVKSRELFDKAIAAHPAFLDHHVLLAQTWATKKQDRKTFRAELNWVLEQPVDTLPEMKPEMEAERRKARALLSQEADYFAR